MDDTGRDESDVLARAHREKRWLLGCFLTALASTVIGVVAKELADQGYPQHAIVVVFAVVAGVLFLASLCATLALWFHFHGVAAFQEFQGDELTGWERRAVLRAINRNHSIPPEHRAAGLSMALSLGSKGYWPAWWALYWALICGCNVVAQTGVIRLLWAALLCGALGFSGYCFRLTKNAQRAVRRLR